MSEVKIKGEAIKENSIQLSALSKEIYNRINNVLYFGSDYSIDYNTEDPEGNNYYLITKYTDHINKFKEYLYNLCKYGAMGAIRFNFPQDTDFTFYLPFMEFNINYETILDIVNNDFSKIDTYIVCSWGIALNDNNEYSNKVSLKLCPKENKLYIKIIEI